jgi:hypothetical protein
MRRPENPGQCDCCGFETQAVTLYPDSPTHHGGGGKIVNADFWFCDLCANTPASANYRYPLQPPSTLAVMQAMCVIGNRILEELEKRR